MATITITIVDLPHSHVSVRTDASKPIVGRGVTLAEGLAMELLGTAFKRGAEVIYDPDQVPTIALALALLDPDMFGHAATPEIRDRARRALGRDKIDYTPTDGADIDRIYRVRAAAIAPQRLLDGTACLKPAEQDGRDFYELRTGRLIATYPTLVKGDFDLAGAQTARTQFLKDHPGYAMDRFAGDSA